MTKAQILGIVRHALTFVGGFLVMKGGLLLGIIGGASALVGAVWSWIENKVGTTTT